jgi:SAM-dependent methyltransferase
MAESNETEDEQKALWNGVAGRAWVDAQNVVDQMFKSLEDLLVEGVAPGTARVLDIGCGTGGTTLAIARRLGAGGSSVGLDISEPMIAAARDRAAREKTPATFLCADAATHPFDAEAFDALVSRFGVMFFADPVAAFANLRRAARTGADLRLIVWRSAAENPFMTTAERAAAPLLPNIPPRRPDAPGQFAFADRDRVARILEESGWAEIDIQPFDAQCTFPEVELVRYLTQFGPLGRVFREIDERTRELVTKTVRAAFDPYVHGSEVRFDAACWLVRATSRGSNSFPTE